MRRPQVLVLVLLGALLGALLTGCGYEGASSLPLPGAIGGSDTYPVTVVLSDATNLVPKETCRSNDTVIGSVASVELDEDLHAEVVCRIKDSVHLPANAVATLSETSLLGERFVSLDPPAGVPARGTLEPGSTMPAATTRIDPNVEMVLGALSQVLNGGSLGSLHTITKELNAALTGSDLGGSLKQISTVVATLDDHRTEITDSLASLDRLTGTLARQKRVLADALDSIPGGLAVLERQRGRLVATLTKLSSLSRTATPLLEETRADTVADLKHLAPVLTELSKASDEIAATLGRVVTFPFPSTIMSTIKGDYAGAYATLDIDVDLINGLLGGAKKSSTSQPAPPSSGVAPRAPGASTTAPGPLAGLVAPITEGLTSLLNGLLGGGR